MPWLDLEAVYRDASWSSKASLRQKKQTTCPDCFERRKLGVYAGKDVDGEQVGVWGTSVLDTKFAQIAQGKMVAIEYQGKKQSEKRKGSSYHDFKVGVGIDVVGDEDPFAQ